MLVYRSVDLPDQKKMVKNCRIQKTWDLIFLFEVPKIFHSEKYSILRICSEKRHLSFVEVQKKNFPSQK